MKVRSTTATTKFNSVPISTGLENEKSKMQTEFTSEIIALVVEYATLYYTNLELYDEGIPPAPKEFQEAI